MVNIVKPRHFNKIIVKKDNGVVIKSSSEEKLKNEVLWYINLPTELKWIAPKIHKFKFSKENEVIMEYVPYEALHNLYLKADSKTNWDTIFKYVISLHESITNYTVKIPEDERIKSLYYMYVKKTIDRIEDLQDKAGFETFFYKEIRINNKTYKSLSEYTKLIEEIINETNLLYPIDFKLIHGDLCFSNILYTSQENKIKVIDPRGMFGEVLFFGDPRYDIAKLAHSAHGRYDLIISDNFCVEHGEDYINYKFNHGNMYQLVEEKLWRHVSKEYSIQEIKLIESLLFFSMIPLHCDYVDRQYVMLARAIELFSKVMEE